VNQDMQCLDHYGIWLVYNQTRDKKISMKRLRNEGGQRGGNSCMQCRKESILILNAIICQMEAIYNKQIKIEFEYITLSLDQFHSQLHASHKQHPTDVKQS